MCSFFVLGSFALYLFWHIKIGGKGALKILVKFNEDYKNPFIVKKVQIIRTMIDEMVTFLNETSQELRKRRTSKRKGTWYLGKSILIIAAFYNSS
jgi:hypothetical protein